MNVRRVAFALLLGLTTFITLAFLFLPIAAVFTRVPLHRLLSGAHSPLARAALRLTVETNAISLVILLAVGTPAAYLLARRRFRGRSIVLTLVELPLVLPPAVAGIGLLAAYNSRVGVLPHPLSFAGIGLDFTTPAVVVAVLFVSSPFYLRGAIAAFEGVDQDAIDASRTLGAGPARTFIRVALPLASGGLGAGAALAFARGIGEFGATIMFAGNLQGVTQTLPLAIYQVFEGGDFNVALSLSVLLIAFSAAILLTVKLIGTWTRSLSTSPFHSATTPLLSSSK